jgi:hypothetical protein
MSAIWEKLETWIFVTIITVLVWVYAENENVKQHELEVSLRPVAEGGKAVLIAPPEPRTVRMSIRCSQSQLQQLRTFARTPFDVPLTADPENPTQVIDVKTLLAGVEPFSDLGVNILDTDPARISYSVEALQTVGVEIRVVAPEGVQLAPGVSAEPTRAEVRLTQRYASLLATQKLEARLDMENLADYEENVPHSLDVPLSLPSSVPALRATIIPSTARVTFTIRKQTDTYMIDRVPVNLVVSPVLMQQFDVSVPPDQIFVRDVKVTGPSDMIRRIREGDVKVIAELRLSADNLEQRIESAVPYIDLPQGVTLTSQVPRINLTIRPRADTLLAPP